MQVILLLLGVTWATEDNPLLNPDPYEVAESRSEVVVARQLLDPQAATTDKTKGQLQGRRRRLGTRRRRPLDPERRRQLLLRRQRLGLPLRRRLRPLLQEGESPSSTTTTTTQAPLTSTSTSSSFSSRSVSSSSSSSTTLRSIFPSFSVASRVRAGPERRLGWGNKTPLEKTEKKEDEVKEEARGELTEAKKDLGELISSGELKERRRGVSKILKRPLYRRLTPALTPTRVTTPVPARRDRDERLRFRPLLSGKRVRGGRRKPTLTTRPRLSPSSSSSTTPTAIPTTASTTTTTTTTTTAAPTSSLSPPPTSSTDPPFLHSDSHPLLHHPDSPGFWQDSSSSLHTDSTTPHPESSTFDQDSLVFLHDSRDIFEPGSPAFDFDPPTVPPDSSVFGPDVFPPPPPTFLPAPRPAPPPSKPRHTPVPKKVTIAPQPSRLLNPKFRAIRRFKPETQDAKSIVPKPKHISLDSHPAPPSFVSLNPRQVTQKPDYVVNEDSNSFVTQRFKHFESIPSYLTQHDRSEEEGQRHVDPFPSHVAKQDGFELPEPSHFEPFSRFVTQESPSHQELEHFDTFPSYVAQVTPQPSYVTRDRNYVPEEPIFITQNPTYERDRKVLPSTFTPSSRDRFRDSPARSTTDQAVAGQVDSLHARRHSSPRTDHLLHDSELVYAPNAGFGDSLDPLYHTEVIYTPDQGDRSYDEADTSVYEDEEVQLEGDYENDFEDEPGVLDHYKYGYQVESEDTGNFQQRYEARDGATVSGSYKVALPDGRVQVVTYVADDGGFRAEVSYEGEDPSPADPTPTFTPAPTPAPAPPSPPPPTIETPPAAPFPISNSRRLAPRQPRPSHLRAARKNLRFSGHVTTASPNPFRLVVEGGRASTHAPPTTPYPTPINSHTATSTILQGVQDAQPPTPRRKHVPTTTNAHTIAPPHSLVHGPSSSTITTTTAPPPPPHTPTPRYEYDSLHNKHTILYTPTTDATAYIHTLGRSHAVPVLLPVPHTHPRTYFLNQANDREGDSVEIQRGDASRPRISIHTPSPHQTDIYPSPRPPIYRFA